MHGRTKSFLEDVLMFLVLSIIAFLVYYFFFSEEPQQQTQVVETYQIETPIKQTEDEKSVETESLIENEAISDIKKESNTPIKVDEKPQVDQTITLPQEDKIPKEIEKTPKDTPQKNDKNVVKNEQIDEEKKVDLQELHNFLNDTKQKIQDNIVLTDITDKENLNLSIRITVLKNGLFEQLTFVSGNKQIFDANKDNITKIFPLNIDEKIIADFPRYLRFSFEFNIIEE